MAENLDLSHLQNFEEVREELGLRLSKHEHLYRDADDQIVLFRGQTKDYPDALPLGRGGMFGPGVYFGNQPVACGMYARFARDVLQAYRLPPLDCDDIVVMSRVRASLMHKASPNFKLQVFPVGAGWRLEERFHRKQTPTECRPMWLRMPSPEADEEIAQTKKLAYLGQTGLGPLRRNTVLPS